MSFFISGLLLLAITWVALSAVLKAARMRKLKLDDMWLRIAVAMMTFSGMFVALQIAPPITAVWGYGLLLMIAQLACTITAVWYAYTCLDEARIRKTYPQYPY